MSLTQSPVCEAEPATYTGIVLGVREHIVPQRTHLSARGAGQREEDPVETEVPDCPGIVQNGTVVL